MDLSSKLDESVQIGNRLYTLNLAYDNVLRLFDMFKDPMINELDKPIIAVKMLIKEQIEEPLTLNDYAELFEELFEQYISGLKGDERTGYDLEGNPLPSKFSESEKALYDLKKDGEYIYSSFIYAYGIDLFDVQGSLRWEKFNALLSGLPEDSKLMQVMKIRAWKPSKGESSEYKKQMRELQEIYKLDEEGG